MKQIFIALFTIVAVVALIVITFTINQVNHEEERLKNDMVYRSTLLADSLRETVEPNFVNKSENSLQTMVDRFTNKERFAGLGIYGNKGQTIAASSTIPKATSSAQQIIADAMDADRANGDFMIFEDKKIYALAIPLHDDARVVGALLVIQNAGYIDDRLREIWRNNVIRFLLQASLLSLATLLLIRWIIYQPVKNLVDLLRLTRTGKVGKNVPNISGSFFFKPLIKELTSVQRSLSEARAAVLEEARLRMERLDSPWTSHRLKAYTKDILDERTIVVVSNREPFVHTKNGNKFDYYIPASGMVTAIEPLMESCGGIWIAHGSGNADQLVVDQNDHIKTPPDEPKYTLRRIWLTEQEENHYYSGFSNEGLWPLCHNAHVRPIFRKEDWEEYKNVNGKFTKAVLSEIKEKEKPIIFIQDFHLALLPKIVKQARPDATVGIFWHIPWPNEESFSICPWKKEILEGILGADLVAFHTQLYCNNFVETVSKELESLIDLEQFSITRNDHTSYIKPLPIGIAFPNTEYTLKETEDNHLLKELNITSKYIGIGVDRLDYTKGLLEKIKGIELFFKNYPSFAGQFTFIQLAAPSKSTIVRYRQFAQEVDKEVERVNSQFKHNGWKPIVLIKKHHSREEINKYYRLANLCLVTSLHDGMNLVSKEFIASKNDKKGVLILSQFTGSSKELREALIINPYNALETAEAIRTALEMPVIEQTKRMRTLRETIKGYNIYRWAAEVIKTMASLG